MIGTASGPGEHIIVLGHEPQPPALGSWPRLAPGTTRSQDVCGMRTAHSNHIKPLNVVDQSQEAGGLRLAVSRVRWVTLRLPLHSQDRTGPAGPVHRRTAGTADPSGTRSDQHPQGV